MSSGYASKLTFVHRKIIQQNLTEIKQLLYLANHYCFETGINEMLQTKVL